MSSSINDLYEFGDFRLEAETGTLWRNNAVVPLSPKSAELLQLLIQRRGRTVTKQEIFDSIWAGTFVEDGVLAQNVYTLRNVLGRDENGGQFIETIPRRGYRFAGQLSPPTAAERTDSAASNVEGDDLPTEETGEILNGVPFNRKDRPFNEGSSRIVTSSVSHGIGPSRLVLIGALGILLFAAAGFGIYRFALPEGKNVSKIAPIEQVRFKRLTDTGDVIHPTLAPNGELLAYVRLEDEQASIWIKQIATGSAFQTLSASRKGYRSLTFSPDGSHLFFREETIPGPIYQIPVFGGTPKKVAENVWSDFSVSPDGKQLAFIRRDASRDASALVISNVDGSGDRELSISRARTEYSPVSPAWSPDGATLTVAGGAQPEARRVLLSIDVSTAQQTEHTAPRWREVTRVLRTPNGKHLIVAARSADESSSQLWMLNYPDGEVRRLTNDLESYFWVSLSADGRMLAARQQRVISHLWLMPEGNIKKARQLTSGERNLDGFVGLAMTPDERIVFSSREGHVTDLQSIDLDGGSRLPLTANAAQDNTWPNVSSDGRHIVFTSQRTGGTRQVWRMNADGSNQKQLTSGEESQVAAFAPALSPDGREVYFIKRAVSSAAIWKVPIDGGEAVQVSRLVNAWVGGFLSVSPDGKWIAFRYVSTRDEASSDEPTMRIGILPSDGNGDPRLFDLPMRRPMVRWSADSTAFDYSAGTFNASSLWRQPLNGDKPRKLFDLPDRIFNFAWSADGKDLVVARGKQLGDAILITNLP